MTECRLPILFTALLLLLGYGGSAGAFRAELADSRWQSIAGARACHLVHDVPRFGTLVVTQYADLSFAGTIITRRPPAGERLGALYRVTAPWKGEDRERVREVEARPGLNTVSLDARSTRQIVRGLEDGHYMALRFPAWAVGAIEAAVSPVRFRPALDRHLGCLARFDRTGTPPTGSAGGADGDTAATAMPAVGDIAGARSGGGGSGGSASDARTMAAGAATGADGTVRTLPHLEPTRVYFAHSSANVDRVDLDTLRAIGERLAGARYWSRIVITGHTDSSGSTAYNRALGLARAIEVRNQLVRLGVAEDRIAVRTRGERAPNADNGSAYGRARNRQVTIIAEH